MNIASSALPSYLVIGYGNTLRSDDGAGYIIAERVEQWNLAAVRSCWVHQLTPELAAELATVDTVIFVDAAVGIEAVSLEALFPLPEENFTAHRVNPRSLLHLAATLYDKIPTAYQILIPATDFSFGDRFSLVTQAGISQALSLIQQLTAT